MEITIIVSRGNSAYIKCNMKIQGIWAITIDFNVFSMAAKTLHCYG